ncbi:hypothetical protein M0638_11170 [Roseomonas sp. NAR14]|uniref:Uncharacterized protein n=1 Tax=Roseomonas acroporae TaxID=2937791 RepID=A0A9X1Y8C8_9PROT|nr:hypothetical protein [Roseomonas acroporae]MCK8784942.1 hypothetical protein [Roseomonas acroporae]
MRRWWHARLQEASTWAGLTGVAVTFVLPLLADAQTLGEWQGRMERAQGLVACAALILMRQARREETP